MKVCIVAHSAKGFGELVGGSERQSALLARALAARGHDVVYVVAGLAGGDRSIDGVRLRAAWDPQAGMRFLRAATHRYPRLLRLLRGERADVYYARGAGYYTPFAMRAARDVGAASVLAMASDKDLYSTSGKVLFKTPSARLSALVGPIAHAGFRRWALRAADCVAVQNDEQAAACAALGLRHAILPSIVESPPDRASGDDARARCGLGGQRFRGPPLQGPRRAPRAGRTAAGGHASRWWASSAASRAARRARLWRPWPTSSSTDSSRTTRPSVGWRSTAW